MIIQAIANICSTWFLDIVIATNLFLAMPFKFQNPMASGAVPPDPLL